MATLGEVEQRRSSGGSRRRFMKQAGLASVGILGASGLATRAAAQSVTDADILNFALNLEYLEAEYYLRAFFGTGLTDADVTGTGTPGNVIVKPGSTQVPWVSPNIAQYCYEIALDELAHVRFLRAALQSKGVTPVARPTIDLLNSFTAAAQAAGVIATGGATCPPGMPASPRPADFFVPTQDCQGWVPANHPLAMSSAPTMFDPFANEVNFLLGAFIFEDVGVTAYKGAAALISDKAVLEAAAGILAVEAYHAGAVRTTLFARGIFDPVQKISNLRDAVDGSDDRDQGIAEGNTANIVPTDANGLAFSRSAADVMNIVYLGGASGNFGFFPNRLNGTIR